MKKGIKTPTPPSDLSAKPEAWFKAVATPDIAVIIVVLIAFAIGLLTAIGYITTLHGPNYMVEAEFSLAWITRAIGVFIATVASLGLLLKSLGGESLDRLVSLTLPLLAGLLLNQAHWPIAIALGVIAVAVVVREIIALFVHPKAEEWK